MLFKHPLLKIVTLAICIPLGIYLLMLYQKKTNVSDIIINPLPLATPTPVKPIEVHSIEGSLKLIMQEKTLPEGINTYTFFVADITGENQRLLFTKTASGSGTMTIPANSWSPDNKYVFLRESENGSIHVLVFKASGQAFADGQKYLDVIDLFAKRLTTEFITDVTGWDAPALLHVKASSFSYWFDIDSRSFLQLATR